MSSCLRKTWAPFVAGALAVAIGAALGGCKERSAPASAGATLPPAPVLHAEPVTANPLGCDPLTAPLWRRANWSHLGSPINDNRGAPPTQVACAYDATNLYVAFICSGNDVETEPAAKNPWEQDSVELWLDTAAVPRVDATGQPESLPRAVGCEVIRVVATPQGQAYTFWYRAASPPKPRDDGSPDFAHPISMIPNIAVQGLKVKAGAGVLDGQHVWTAVVALPLAKLPAQLRAQPEAGAHWHANLIRNDWIQTSAGTRDLLQSNFSPVYQSAQAVSPYRMADLVLDSDQSPILTLQIGN